MTNCIFLRISDVAGAQTWRHLRNVQKRVYDFTIYKLDNFFRRIRTNHAYDVPNRGRTQLQLL